MKSSHGAPLPPWSPGCQYGWASADSLSGAAASSSATVMEGSVPAAGQQAGEVDGLAGYVFTTVRSWGYHAPVRASRAAAVVLASGSGVRVGGERNKVYLPLGGLSIVAWSLRAFAATPGIAALLLVIRPQDESLVTDLLAGELAG